MGCFRSTNETRSSSTTIPASDNWIGEYAVLLANNGGPLLAGIVITGSSYWPNAKDNATGWSSLVLDARSSGLKNIPDVTTSGGKPLTRPADGQIDDTVANNSEGAQRIMNLSRELSLPWRPVVVVVGTQMTDVADAYLIDRSVAERVVVVAALGSYAAPNGAMNAPNGELDPWADWIVAQRFQYVQVSAFYDQTGDVTTAELPSLPSNPLGSEMATKQPNLFTITTASDQVGILSVGLPAFVVGGPARIARHLGGVRFHPGAAAGAERQRQRLDRHTDRDAPRRFSPLADAARARHSRFLTPNRRYVGRPA